MDLLSTPCGSLCLLPGGAGARVRRQQVYSDVHGGLKRPLCAESIAQPLQFVKRVIGVAVQFVCALDKPGGHAMIRWRCRKGVVTARSLGCATATGSA